MSEKIQLEKYDDAFYQTQLANDKKKNAASFISKLVLDKCGKIQSVVDVGCGIGIWPKAFMEHGVQTVHGVDGDYISPDLMLLPRSNFFAHDLRNPIKLDTKYDLACSLEVAEHLPPSRAKGFVEDLTKLAPIILFSAAIPGQGGENHVNELWQHHWARMFAEHSYLAVDLVRPVVWSMQELQVCYRQNTLLYVHDSVFTNNPQLKEARENTNEEMLPLVHPRTLVRLQKQWKN